MVHVAYEMNFEPVKDFQDGSINKKINKAMAYVVRNSLTNLERHHKKKWFLRGRAKDPKTDPNKIIWRTGGLAKSYITYWKSGALFGYYGSTLKRAALLEYGGTIRPVSAKALAIPTRFARVGVGAGLRPRDYPPGVLFIPKFKGVGSGVLAMIGPGGVLRPMFVLTKQAKIPPRPTVAKAAKEQEKKFQKDIADTVIKVLRGDRARPN